jgi:hypothetical protein
VAGIKLLVFRSPSYGRLSQGTREENEMTGTPLSAHPLPQVFLNSHLSNGNCGIHYAWDSDGSSARNDDVLKIVFGRDTRVHLLARGL